MFRVPLNTKNVFCNAVCLSVCMKVARSNCWIDFIRNSVFKSLCITGLCAVNMNILAPQIEAL
jgi:hypothetical protein